MRDLRALNPVSNPCNLRLFHVQRGIISGLFVGVLFVRVLFVRVLFVGVLFVRVLFVRVMFVGVLFVRVYGKRMYVAQAHVWGTRVRVAHALCALACVCKTSREK